MNNLIIKQMKTLKFTVLVLTILIMNSCNDKSKIKEVENLQTTTEQENNKGQETPIVGLYPFYQHALWLGFKDAAGNDLIEKTVFELIDSETGKVIDFSLSKFHGTKPELYTLDVIFEAGIPNEWKPAPNPFAIYDVRYPRFFFSKEWQPEQLHHTENNYLWFSTHSYRNSKFAEKIILRLTCPSLFGDNEAHDIVTWWELLPLDSEPYYTMCSRVEYGCKEFPVSEQQITTIILDGK